MPKVTIRKRVTHFKRHKRKDLVKVISTTSECRSIDVAESSAQHFHSPTSPSTTQLCSPPSDLHLSGESQLPGPCSSGVPPLLADHTYASPSEGSPMCKESPELRPPQECPSTTKQKLLLDVKEKITLCLPMNWIPVVDDKGIFLLMLSRQGHKAVQRSVHINVAGDVDICVHCQRISPTPFIKNALPPLVLEADTLGHFVDRSVQIVNSVRLMQVCAGCDFPEYRSVWSKCESGEIDKNPYQESRYTETLRSVNCCRLTESSKWRCFECSKLMLPLRRRLISDSREQPHANTTNVNLTEAQRLRKLSEQRKEIKSSRKALQRLRSQRLLAKEGVQVDKKLSKYLTEILNSANLSPEQSLLIEEQVKASQTKKMCGMRWHPTMIRVALAVYLNSPAAYETLRDSGVLKLPSRRTLFDYTHFKPVKEGIDEVAVESVARRVEKCSESYQKYHVLMADEMYISKHLVFEKKSGKIVGYTSLDNVDKEVKILEEFLETLEPVEATKVLAYMVKGVANNIKEVVASFAVVNPSPNQMYGWTWSVIGALERSGIAIVTFICDGSSTNRAFIKLHEPITSCDSGVIFDTVNKAAPHRPLFFISDVPHLLKTIRNCFAKSRLGKRGKRTLKKNGQYIVWDYIIRLYQAKKGKVLKKSYKLNPQNVFLDSFSCMKVIYAAQVLSRTVAQDLKDQNWEGVEETRKFIEIFNDWFDCLNGAHSDQGKKTRNPRLNPYNSPDDPRFQFLLSVLQYLQDWKEEAIKTSNLTLTVLENSAQIDGDLNGSFNPIEDYDGEVDENTPAGNKLLSHQTLYGIEMTTRAFIGATTFLLEEKTKFINGRIFCQDPLEQFFSKQRAGGGGSTNPNLGQFLAKQRGIHMQGQTGVKRRRRGNTETMAKKLEITEDPLPKKSSCHHLKSKP